MKPFFFEISPSSWPAIGSRVVATVIGNLLLAGKRVTDGTTVAEAYRKHGLEQVINQSDGDFAFLLVDGEKKKSI